MQTLARAAVLRHRLQAQQLDHDGTIELEECTLLDLGAQDTGADGARWALAVRGVQVADPDRLVLAWTLRGSPTAYRRSDLPAVVDAVAPLSEADAARRIFDAAKPLKAAGRPVLAALTEVARTMRDIVREPMVKGEVSAALTERTGPELHRWCRPCGATHLYEQPFRLAALFGGLELEPGTSPPVLRRIPGWEPTPPGPPPPPAAVEAEPSLQVVRGYLRLLGPATPRDVAAFLDAPVTEVKKSWPEDAVEVDVDGRRAWLLAADADHLATQPPPAATGTVRLLAPYDLYLQARDRDTLVPDRARQRTLWPVLGRPGAVVADGEIVGTWRPRAQGRRLTVRVQEWCPADAGLRRGIEAQAELLARSRGVALAGVVAEEG